MTNERKNRENCDSCQFSSYSGGQEGYAEGKGVPVESLGYKYCSLKHALVYKNEVCVDYQLKVVRKFVFIWHDWQRQIHEFCVDTMSVENAKKAYYKFQSEQKLHKVYDELFEYINGERVKIFNI